MDNVRTVENSSFVYNFIHYKHDLNFQKYMGISSSYGTFMSHAAGDDFYYKIGYETFLSFFLY